MSGDPIKSEIAAAEVSRHNDLLLNDADLITRLEQAGGKLEISPGIFMDASPDLIRALKAFFKSIDDNAVVYGDRRHKSEAEAQDMGGKMIPVGGAVVVKASKRAGVVYCIRRGAFDRPYYKITLDKMGKPFDEVDDVAFAYARDLVFSREGLVDELLPDD